MTQPTTTLDGSAGQLDCATVVANLEACDSAALGDEIVDRMALHVAQCHACLAWLDRVAPEPTLPTLEQRLSAQASAELAALGELGEAEREIAALLLLAAPEDAAPVDRSTPAECRIVNLSEARGTLRARSPIETPCDGFGQFLTNQVIHGAAGDYVIKALRRISEFSETYEAIVQGFRAGSGVQQLSRVIVKIPRVAGDLSYEGANERLAVLGGLLRAVELRQQRLVGSPHVAQVIDSGEYDHHLGTNTSRSVFVIYRDVRGKNLVDYAQARYGQPFTGLTTAREFFRWARRLTQAVLDVHNRVVVHGDICPRNIIIDGADERVVFVGVGESLFAQAMHEPRLRGGAYRAPDQENTPSTDLFSLGGVLYFLATGADPHGLGHCDSHELLKQQVEDHVRAVNPRLFDEDAGVIDVIARCLRRHGRVQHARQLLDDIETFDPTLEPLRLAADINELHGLVKRLESRGSALFQVVAAQRTRALTDLMKDMDRGVLDISGDSKAVCSAACALISHLREGDAFLTNSIPQFWYPGNMGLNGRFLTTSRMAASRNVRIRRILFLEDALDEPYLEGIVAAHRKVAADLRYSANYSVKYWLMPSEERREFIRQGRHFGLFELEGGSVAMFPVYDDGKLVTLRFRTDEKLVAGLRQMFHDYFERARPLADLHLAKAAAHGAAG